MKAKEIREMRRVERIKALDDLRGELLRERGLVIMGGSATNTMKIRALRKDIARMLTVEGEEKSE